MISDEEARTVVRVDVRGACRIRRRGRPVSTRNTTNRHRTSEADLRVLASRVALDRTTTRAAPRFDVRAASTKLRDHLTDWQGMLRQEGPQSRHVLTALLTGRLSFEPKGKDKDRYYEFSGPGHSVRLSPGGWC